MSLWRNRRRIASAAAGELSARDEAALRAHLATCDACRAHYDLLTMTARVARGGPAPTSEDIEHGLARVLRAAQVEPAPRRASLGPLLVWSAVLVGSLAVVTALQWERAPSTSFVQERGGDDTHVRHFSLRVYAKLADGPVRLVADFPSAGEAHVTEHDWVQFKAGTGEQVWGEREGAQVQFELAHSAQLAKGRWQVFVSRPPLAERVPAGVLWVE